MLIDDLKGTIVDFSLTREQQEWIDKAKRLAPTFAERARKYDEAAEFTHENFDPLRDEGFLALAVPTEFGGHGKPSGNAAFIPYLVIEEFAKADATTSWNLAIHFHQCGVVARLGSDEQRERILGDVAKRGVLMGSLGSEVNPTQAKAPKDTKQALTFQADFAPVEGGFIANGSKHFCSVGPVAEYLLFWALAPGTSSSAEGLAQAVVPANSPGIEWHREGWDEAIGLRASVSWSAELKDVFIPWENVLGQPGDFVQKDPFTYELSHTAHLLGIAQGTFDAIVRVINDRPYLMNEDTVPQLLASMDAGIQSTRSSFWYANWLWENQRWGDAQLASIRALHTAKDTALLVTTKAFDIVGTRALLKFYPFERMWRDMRTASLHTRQWQLDRLLAEAIVDGGEFFPKEKYGRKLSERKTWEELGVASLVQAD